MFGGFFPGFGFGNRHRGQAKSEDTILEVTVTLEDLYNGGKKIALTFHPTLSCNNCHGKGSNSDSAIKCVTCSGTGVKVILQQLGPNIARQMQTRCTECHGNGEIIPEKDRCHICKGSKTVKLEKSIEVEIDKGMRNGQKIIFHGEGNQLPETEAGDVIVIVHQSQHDRFTRQEDNLYINTKLTLTEALCGFILLIQHLDGRSLCIKSPKGKVYQSDDIKCIKNEGMPHHKNPFEHGNLFIKFEVVFPENYFQTPEKIIELENYLPPRLPFIKPLGKCEIKNVLSQK